VELDQRQRDPSLSGLQDILRALRSSRRFIDILEMTGEQARAVLDGDTLSLSEWDRDLGRLVTRVNLGRLSPGEERFPVDEIYELTRESAILLETSGFLVQADDPEAPEPDRTILVEAGLASGITVPISSEGRLWGELWVTRSAHRPAYGAEDLVRAGEVAELVGEVVASGQLLERTARLAFEDPLTRLANRRVFDDRLAELLEGEQSGATVVLCDLDGLKAINDEDGHAAGDRVIILAADALSVVASHSPGCVASRIGGDEFALVLPGDQRSLAVAIAQRAAELLARGAQRASMSCGVAAAPAGTSPRTLFVTADAALYGAKHRGVQLLLSSELGDTDHELLRARPSRKTGVPPRRRRWDDATDRPYAADASAAVADAVQALAEGMSEIPDGLPAALRWVGDTLLGPLDLDRWVLGRVGDSPDGRVFLLDSLGLRHVRPGSVPSADEAAIGQPRAVSDFPTAEAAIREGTVFGFELDPRPTDGVPPVEAPTEVTSDLLRRMGMRFVVGAGARGDSGEWLLSLFGSTDHVPVTALREVLALALAAATRQDGEHE
jgi:diguanylate cyclase (GGDEF)-like protein